MKEKLTKSEKIFDKIAPLLGKYLEANGWNPVLISSKGIGQEGKFKYVLMFGFLGSKKKDNKKPNGSKKLHN